MLASNLTTPKPRKQRTRKQRPLAVGAIVNSVRHTAYVRSASSDPHSGFIAAIYEGVQLARYHYWESSLRDIMAMLDGR